MTGIDIAGTLIDATLDPAVLGTSNPAGSDLSFGLTDDTVFAGEEDRLITSVRTG